MKHNRTLLHKDSSQEEKNSHKRRPRRPPFLRVLSVGTGVTSSMRPIFKPERESARRADCPPGPGLFVLLPPVARILICRAGESKFLRQEKNLANQAPKTTRTGSEQKVQTFKWAALTDDIVRTLHRTATSWAASIAAYGEASSRSALTFIPPEWQASASTSGSIGGGDYGLAVSRFRLLKITYR